MGLYALLVVSCLAVASAIPAPSPVIRKLDPGYPRYQYAYGADGVHLVDLWGTAEDLAEAARFEPDRQNVYHLFTRENPTVSQPLLLGEVSLLSPTNYNPLRRTIVIVHGWTDSVSGDFASVMVPAFLSAEDVNVIVADWSVGAGTLSYFAAVTNTVTSGQSVARFINWLNSVTSSVPAMFHVVGHSLGAHQAGIIGRNVDGDVAYITALDAPFLGWTTNSEKFQSTDGIYTESIHTSILGYMDVITDVAFVPNGGFGMPGCNSQACDHDRCYHYMAESLSSGGFTGRRCLTFIDSLAGDCSLPETLTMGGLEPKTGSSGVYSLETNAAPPFSLG